MDLEFIYVALLDEGVECWRPVTAVRLDRETFRIEDSVPEGEQWEFQPGQTVRCRLHQFSDGQGLVAYEAVSTL
jgi:hypothetical protein